MFLPPVGSPEYSIMIWIIVELAVLFFVIRMNMTRRINPRILSAIGSSIIVFGTLFYLIFAIAIFTIDDYDTICVNTILSSDTLNEDIENKLLGEKLLTCYNQTNDTKWNFFLLSVIMSMVIVFGSILEITSRSRN